MLSPVAPVAFVPSGAQDFAPTGQAGKLAANLDALRTLRAVQAAGRPATRGEQAVLARWSGWGALPEIFDETTSVLAGAREQLQGLLSQGEWRAASRTTLNAHYTHAAYAAAMWRAVQALGFTGGRVLEPGCEAGTFLGLAPGRV